MARKSSAKPALTHIGSTGEARMVDVSAKPVVLREAIARGEIRLHSGLVIQIQHLALVGNALIGLASQRQDLRQ